MLQQKLFNELKSSSSSLDVLQNVGIFNIGLAIKDGLLTPE